MLGGVSESVTAVDVGDVEGEGHWGWVSNSSERSSKNMQINI